MMRTVALAACVLCLAGCFVFDNPVENAVPPASPSPAAPTPTPTPTPTAAFQIVVHGLVFYAGTYVWSSTDNAYEAVINGTPRNIYMDSTGHWCLAWQLNLNHDTADCSTTSLYFAALPVTNGTWWSPGGEIDSIDDSQGGVCRTLVSPDSPAMLGTTLQVTFKASDPGNSATYQWVSSTTQTGTAPSLLGTGSTYTIQSPDYGHWIRVIVTPTDSTGTVLGSPVTSQPVKVLP